MIYDSWRKSTFLLWGEVLVLQQQNIGPCVYPWLHLTWYTKILLPPSIQEDAIFWQNTQIHKYFRHSQKPFFVKKSNVLDVIYAQGYKKMQADLRSQKGP